jgi:hypothetical protein
VEKSEQLIHHNKFKIFLLKYQTFSISLTKISNMEIVKVFFDRDELLLLGDEGMFQFIEPFPELDDIYTLGHS